MTGRRVPTTTATDPPPRSSSSLAPAGRGRVSDRAPRQTRTYFAPSAADRFLLSRALLLPPTPTSPPFYLPLCSMLSKFGSHSLPPLCRLRLLSRWHKTRRGTPSTNHDSRPFFDPT
uniref:Uncharacterized protein n=1 Tax=Plectus sambesii TaxID=2011161 RepID=A0A914WTA8_9BILA